MKTVLYACADLAYDQIFSPVVTTPGLEYCLFADRRPRFVSGWQWQRDAGRGGGPVAHPGEPVLQVLSRSSSSPDADYSIYIDANR